MSIRTTVFERRSMAVFMKKDVKLLLVVILIIQITIIAGAQAQTPEMETNCTTVSEADCHMGCPILEHEFTIVSDTSTLWLTQSGEWQPVQSAYTVSDWDPMSIEDAVWIWPYYQADSPEKEGHFTLQRTFNLPCCAQNISARINISADNAYNLSFNGNWVGSGSNVHTPTAYTLNAQQGLNVITIVGYNVPLPVNPEVNPAGVIYRLDINYTEPIPCVQSDPPLITPCNCTNRSVSIQSAPASTRWTRVPFDGWRPAFLAVHPNPDTWAGLPISGRWIWANQTADRTSNDGRFIFQRVFSINTLCCWQNLTANFTIAADDEFNLTINNKPVNSPNNWHLIAEGPACGQQNAPTAYTYDVYPYLHNGINVINISAQNHGVPCDPTPNHAGIIYNLTISYLDCCPPGYAGDCHTESGINSQNVISEIVPDSTQAPYFPFWPFWK